MELPYSTSNSMNTLVEEEKKTRIYALSDLINIALAYYEVSETQEQKEEAKKLIWKLVNKWLEEISPLEYIPGLVENVASVLKYKLWDVANELSEEDLGRILVDSIVFKKKALENTEHEVLDALAIVLYARANRLLEVLGVNEPEKLEFIKTLVEVEDVSEKLINIVTLIAVTIALATTY